MSRMQGETTQLLLEEKAARKIVQVGPPLYLT
jgi:hypothetical protein